MNNYEWISVNIAGGGTETTDYVYIRKNRRDFIFDNPTPAGLARLLALPLNWNSFSWPSFHETETSRFKGNPIHDPLFRAKGQTK